MNLTNSWKFQNTIFNILAFKNNTSKHFVQIHVATSSIELTQNLNLKNSVICQVCKKIKTFLSAIKTNDWNSRPSFFIREFFLVLIQKKNRLKKICVQFLKLFILKCIYTTTLNAFVANNKYLLLFVFLV